MNVTDGRIHSMKETLPLVMGQFEETVTANRTSILSPYVLEALNSGASVDVDWFGDLGRQTFSAFMISASRYMMEHSPLNTNSLLDKYRIAQVGTGVIASYAELVPLKLLIDRPDVTLTAQRAAEVARKGYGFIEDVIESGGDVGAELVSEYLLMVGPHDSLTPDGVVVGDQLVRPKRLNRFEVVYTSDGQAEMIKPRLLQPTVERIRGLLGEYYSTEEEMTRRTAINCPAHMYQDELTGNTFARRLFDVMIDYSEAHVYPGYIPLAQTVVEAHLSPSEV